MTTDQDDPSRPTIGCLGLIAVPLRTSRLGVLLLVRGERPSAGGPWPKAPPEVQPLSPWGHRCAGALLAFWTMLLPGALAVAVIRAYHDRPAGLILGAGLVWVAMFVGHLMALFTWQRVEPHLPKR
jgi:hypothetical protein